MQESIEGHRKALSATFHVWFAYGFSIVLLVAVIRPAFWEPYDDSFPLSTYPMFSKRREQPWFHHVRGMTVNREVVPLTPEALGNDEIMQASAITRRAIETGRQGMRHLCRDVAERVALLPKYLSVRYLEVVSEQHDPVKFFAEARVSKDGQKRYGPALQSVVRYRCSVMRAIPKKVTATKAPPIRATRRSSR